MLPIMPTLKFPSVALALLLCLAPATAQDAPATSAGLPDGIVLPNKGTVFAIDRKGDHSALVQLHASEISSNSHAAGNFARSMVYAGAHASAELKGLNAAITISDDHASFLVRINTDDPEVARAMVHLIRLEQSKSTRIVSVFSENVFGGGRKKKYDDVSIVKLDAEPDVWLKLTPVKPLAPGEYGIAFIPKDPNLTAGVVYDFDISPEAAKPDKK